MTLCEKCGDTFPTWDNFQRHNCVMAALRERGSIPPEKRIPVELVKVIFIPKARMTFTEEEVSALFQASAAHYDAKCRQAGQLGGVLWGMRNMIEEGKVETDLEWGQVDLLAKISEQLELTHRNDPAFVARMNYGPNSFHNVLSKLRVSYEEVNRISK